MGAGRQRRKDASPRSPGRGVILLKDRDPALRESLQDALGPDFRVWDETESAGSARVLVLVADLPPGGLKGLTPVAEFRARHPAASLVLLAFYDHHYQEAHAFLDRVADAVVLKPVDLDGLARTIRILAERADPSAGPPNGHGRLGS